MFLDKDYYATPARGNVPAWTNEMAEITWHHWLTFDGLSPQHRPPRPPCSCIATAASCRKTFLPSPPTCAGLSPSPGGEGGQAERKATANAREAPRAPAFCEFVWLVT